MVDLVDEVVHVLSRLDQIESEAVGMLVGKRTHLINAFVEEWLAHHDPEKLDEALTEAVTSGAVVYKKSESTIALK